MMKVAPPESTRKSTRAVEPEQRPGGQRELEPKYNKFYIGTSRDGQPFIILFRPRKNRVNLEIALPRTDEVDQRLHAAGIETLEYSNRWGKYRLSLDRQDIEKNRDLLKELMGLAYENRAT